MEEIIIVDDLLFRIITLLLLLIAIITFVAVVKCIMPKGNVNLTDLIQATVAVGLFIIAYYGLGEYKEIRRPYVSLMEVKAESNLTNDNILINFPKYEKNNDCHRQYQVELNNLWGTRVSTEQIRHIPQCIRDQIEEILISLRLKNNGLVGAINCHLKYFFFSAYDDKPLKELWEEAEKHGNQREKKIIECKGENLALSPQQEQTYGFMFLKKDMAQGNIFHFLCDIQYDSIKDKKMIQKRQDNNKRMKKGTGRTYRILNLYQIWYPQAHSDIYYASLIKSEVYDKD